MSIIAIIIIIQSKQSSWNIEKRYRSKERVPVGSQIRQKIDLDQKKSLNLFLNQKSSREVTKSVQMQKTYIFSSVFNNFVYDCLQLSSDNAKEQMDTLTYLQIVGLFECLAFMSWLKNLLRNLFLAV